MHQPTKKLHLEVLPEQGASLAKHYGTGELLSLRWEAGELREMKPSDLAGEDAPWVAPGLVDLQVNGYAGLDFQRDESVDEQALLQAVCEIRRGGCTRFLLTLITSPWDDLIHRIAGYRRIIQRNPELRRAIPGWHLEGPFLSSADGYRGAHDPRWMRDPSVAQIQELRRITEDDRVLLTLAPERPGSIEAIAEAVRSGFVVSFGHTDASAGQLSAAVAAGGRGFTHLGNGCPQLLDRHDNIIWRAFDQEQLQVGLIPDGLHLPPQLFRSMHRALSPARIYWTTDAMSAAGGPPGRYTLGDVEVLVEADGVVRNPLTNSFAGSSLSPLEGIRRGAGMLDRPWQEVWDFFSVRPSQMMGLPAGLALGANGFCLLRES